MSIKTKGRISNVSSPASRVPPESSRVKLFIIPEILIVKSLWNRDKQERGTTIGEAPRDEYMSKLHCLEKTN